MNKEYTPAEAKAWLAGYDAGKAFAKKEWVGLTEHEISAIKAKYGFGVNIFSFTNAIKELETLLKEKNG